MPRSCLVFNCNTCPTGNGLCTKHRLQFTKGIIDVYGKEVEGPPASRRLRGKNSGYCLVLWYILAWNP